MSLLYLLINLSHESENTKSHNSPEVETQAYL